MPRRRTNEQLLFDIENNTRQLCELVNYLNKRIGGTPNKVHFEDYNAPLADLKVNLEDGVRA
jgi:hypothetical protein